MNNRLLLNLANSVSTYNNYCEGYGNSGASGNSYILGLSLGIGVADKSLSHEGSGVLDQIDAFDLAEIDGPYIGQLNMSIVSSFCGPQGAIWGYDLAKHPEIYQLPERQSFPNIVEAFGKTLPIYDAHKLISATQKLFGTVDNRRFILRPGSHVPFASKNIKISTPGWVYAGIAIGIPVNRDRDACLLMEDTGEVKGDLINNPNFEDDLLARLGKSIIKVGINQKVEFEKCFVAVKYAEVKENQVGCALVAAPYFTLAKDAIPKTITGFDFQRLLDLNLDQWEDSNNKTI